jgi:hypothetical protein
MARDQQKIEQVLQSCLDKIESGQETVESVLARYPEFAEQLRPELEIAVWLSTQKDMLNPRPGWVAASKRRVMARYQEEIQTEAPRTGWLGWNPAWLSRFNLKAVQVTFAVVLLLSLLVGGNGVVMAAQDSLPGDRLYPIKTALEKVNLAISMDETKEAQLNLEYTRRRMVEFNRLLLEGRYSDIPESLTNLETQVNQTIDSLDSAAEEDASQTKVLAASLEDILSDQEERLNTLITVAPDTTRPAIQKAKTVSQTGATATRLLIEDLPSPTPTSPPTKKPSGGSQVNEAADNPTSPPASLPTKTPRPQPAATSTPKVAPTTAPIFEPTDAPTSTPPPPPAPTNTPRPPTSVPPPTETKVPPPPPDTPTPVPSPTDTPTIVEPSPTTTNTPLPPTPITPVPTTELPTETPTPPTAAPSMQGETTEPAPATEVPTGSDTNAPAPIPADISAEEAPTPPAD